MGEGAPLGHRPALDGLRAVAALLVVATHTATFLLPDSAPNWASFHGAGMGVDLFFVLSGFLITTLLLEEHERAGRISVRSFYVRRARRLFPAAFALVAIWVTFRASIGVPLRELWESVLVVVTYTTNYYKGAERDVTLGLGHFWTLAVEEQFYLLMPIVLVLLLRRRVELRFLAFGALTMAVGAALWRVWLLSVMPSDDVLFRTDARCDGLLVGVAAAALRAAGSRIVLRLSAFTWPALAGFSVLVLVVSTDTGHSAVGVSLAHLAASLLSAVVILGAVAPTRLQEVVLANRCARYIGERSYSLYLWHVPAIVLVELLLWPLPVAGQIAGAVALSFALATSSFRWVEAPFRAARAGSSAGKAPLPTSR